MAVEDLPPVHRFWGPRDLDGLTTQDLMHIQLMLKSKMECIADKYQRELYRKDRYEWMQLMAKTYREKPKLDYPM